MLGLALVSVAWTAAQSRVTALVYWAGMAADVAIVLLLVRRDAVRMTEGLMQGAVWGAVALGVVAWCSPRTADMRLGNDAFLHPNTLGLELGLATLMAQYFWGRAKDKYGDSDLMSPSEVKTNAGVSPLAALGRDDASRGGAGAARRGDGAAKWKWVTAALAVTLLRTLSKTAILAFVIAEGWVLLQHRGITRKAKLRIAAAAMVVVACFWGVLTAYVDAYNNAGSGNQVETLTGRTVLWAAALGMGLERPWLGHGIYSFKTLIPAFGSFAAVHAHNEALQQFFELGAAGVVVAAGVYASFYRLARRAGAGELRVLAMGLLIFALVRGLTDTVPLGLSLPLWLVVALAVCLDPAHGSRG
jgi:hypothetical protein